MSIRDNLWYLGYLSGTRPRKHPRTPRGDVVARHSTPALPASRYAQGGKAPARSR